MALQYLLDDSRLRLLPRIRRMSARHARGTAQVVPVIACLPASDVWRLRFAVAFLLHLGQGGSMADRVRRRVVGNPAGHPFDFDHVGGGPLLWAPSLVKSGHLFIGHTVCPGFERIAARVPWWQGTPFCAPGYDYFHEGLNYAHVPVDMAPHAYAAVSVSGMEAAAWAKPTQRAVFVCCDPLEQAADYFDHFRRHGAAALDNRRGRPTDWTFRDYLFRQALPSYAKILVSYQAMARELPGSVSIVPHAQMLERPAEALATMLSHLTGAPRDWPMIEDAVELARPEHLAAVEAELERPLGRRRRRRGAGPNAVEDVRLQAQDPDLRREGLTFLASLGIDTRYLVRPSDSREPMPIVA